MKFPEMGDTWERVVDAFAGSSRSKACDRMETRADQNSHVLDQLSW